jgi:hypothetical protein
MSRKGDCWDNACVESFFATLKTELIHRRPWPTKQEARLAIHEFSGRFYNRQRTHSFLGYMAPVPFKRRFEVEADKSAWPTRLGAALNTLVTGGCHALCAPIALRDGL